MFLSTGAKVALGAATGTTAYAARILWNIHAGIQRQRTLVPAATSADLDDGLEQMTLPDGRTFGFHLPQDFDPSCPVIVVIPGTPECALSAVRLVDTFPAYGEIQQRLNDQHGKVQFVYIDRWGVGLSSLPKDTATLADVAGDVLSLCDHLGVRRFMVDGGSGGGPYAAACAAVLPANRCQGVIMQVPMGPRDIPELYANMTIQNKLGFVYLASLPWLLPTISKKQMEKERLKPPLSKEERLKEDKKTAEAQRKLGFCENDIDALHKYDIMPMLLRTSRYYQHGIGASLLDMELLLLDSFGFNVEDMGKSFPCEIFIGDKDVNTPIEYSHWYVEQSRGKVTMNVYEEYGHFSFFDHPRFVDDYVAFVGKCI